MVKVITVRIIEESGAKSGDGREADERDEKRLR